MRISTCRAVFASAIGVITSSVWSTQAIAQSADPFPSRPITIIVTVAPGGLADGTARRIASVASQKLGQPVIVENKSGASGNIGMLAGVRAKPDGYTVVYATDALTAGPHLQSELKLPFDPLTEITPVSLAVKFYYALVVPPNFPAKTLSEFVAVVKASPNKFTMGSGGGGSTSYLAGEFLQKAAGIQLLSVPYKGSNDVLTALLGGQVDTMFNVISATTQYQDAGKLRVLAVTSPRRLPQLPAAPPIAEFYSGFERAGWMGFYAPKDTPKAIVDKLNAAFVAGIKDAAAEFIAQGIEPVGTSPAEFAEFIKRDIEQNGTVLRGAAIK